MKVLWIGDFGCSTGFARLTHAATRDLHEAGHEVNILGINYTGDPYDHPVLAYPAMRGPAGGRDDAYGVNRCRELAETLKPDVVVIVQDHWNMQAYHDQLPEELPVIGVFCVDGKNVTGKGLNSLRLAIFNTEHGRKEAILGGYNGPSTVFPYGVTPNYESGDQQAARGLSNFPPQVFDKFIVGTVARNSPRKRLDLTIRYFANWIHKYDIDDAFLFIHSLPGAQGWDLAQLGSYYGLKGKLMLTRSQDVAHGCTEEELRQMYLSMDLYANTAQGEGWGLPIMEAMACGIPCIVPDWSALGEWAKSAAHLVPCTTFAHTTANVNVLGGIPDEALFIEGLNMVYNDREYRNELSQAGIALTAESQYDWSNIARRYTEAIEQAITA